MAFDIVFLNRSWKRPVLLGITVAILSQMGVVGSIQSTVNGLMAIPGAGMVGTVLIADLVAEKAAEMI